MGKKNTTFIARLRKFEDSGTEIAVGVTGASRWRGTIKGIYSDHIVLESVVHGKGKEVEKLYIHFDKIAFVSKKSKKRKVKK